MKHMKKMMAAAFIAILAAALCVPALAFAAEIQVKSVINGEEYTAYKILNYTNSGDAYSYYLTKAQYDAFGDVLGTAGFDFTASSDGTQYFVSNAENADVAAIAAYLGEHVADLGEAIAKVGPIAAAGGTVDFGNLATGYYFVTTTAGSLCALHSESDIATAVEKNTITVPDKQQGTAAGSYSDNQLDLNIGDTVYYNSKITIGKGANYEITGTDTLSEGLTLNHGDGEITVKLGTTPIPATEGEGDEVVTNYTLTATDSGFTIVFTPDYVSTLNENDEINIEYSAVINENAVIRGDNPNTWEIDFSNQHEDDSTVVKTYDALVKKIDATTKEYLPGAGFKLYDAATDGNQIIVSKDDKGYYVDPSGDADTEIMIDSEDGVNVRGLAPGTYYLEETTVPDGYNKLAERKPFTVTKDATAAVGISVENNSGAELPSTGGIGTTIFYVIGAILVIGAGVVLITKRRVRKEEQE